MRLLIDDTFATAPFTTPVAAGWLSTVHAVDVELVARLSAERVGPDAAALVPSSELRRLQATHDVLSDVAVIAGGVGAVAMRAPVRPDEIEATPIRLLDVGGSAELLARATVRPFYGIAPTAWIRDDDSPDAARAEVVIVDGAEALREPEGGFSEDLARAWFILTAQPVVSHVLAVPRGLPEDDVVRLVTVLSEARAIALARRRDWRSELAERKGIGRDRASAFWAAQRFTLAADDRLALLDLLAKGSHGTSAATPLNVQFREGISAK